MNKALPVILITIGFFFSNALRAETVLYCQSELATGFFKEGGIWDEGSFKRSRFTLKFKNNFSILEGASFQPMECSIQYPIQRPNLIYCVHSWGEYKTFTYDKTTKRFLYSSITVGGYVDNQTDTDVMYAGKCQIF